MIRSFLIFPEIYRHSTRAIRSLLSPVPALLRDSVFTARQIIERIPHNRDYQVTADILAVMALA